MTSKRFLTCALVAAAAAFPATASAGAGPGDDIDAAFVPPGGVLPLSTAGDPHVLGYEADTSGYGEQSGEPLRCQKGRRTDSAYGKTVWGAFRAPQYGRLDVTAAGFDSVITLIDATANRIIDCTDRLAGRIESFPRDDLPTVKKGRTYGVQVGGALQGGAPAGGLVEIDLELIRPQQTIGDAILTWRVARGGVRISSLKIDGPRGSTITVACARNSCGKPRAYGVNKPVFDEPLAKVGIRASWFPKAPLAAAEKTEEIPVGAAAKTILRGKRIKNGDLLLVAVRKEDEIGQVFYWRVKKNSAGTKSVGCIEPTPKIRIKRSGTCTGR